MSKEKETAEKELLASPPDWLQEVKLKAREDMQNEQESGLFRSTLEETIESCLEEGFEVMFARLRNGIDVVRINFSDVTTNKRHHIDKFRDNSENVARFDPRSFCDLVEEARAELRESINGKQNDLA